MLKMTRDQFLTEKIGECWHEWHLTLSTYGGIVAPYQCVKCGREEWVTEKPEIYNNFSTWEGFGNLWEWAKEQPMFEGLLAYNAAPNDMYTLVPLINPDRFADAVAKYLGFDLLNVPSVKGE